MIIQTNDSLIQIFLFLKIACIFCYLRQVNIKVHTSIWQMNLCHLCSTGSKNHIEERGCANNNSVSTICNNVKRNIPTDDVTCLVCQTDLCNGSSRREITTTTVLCFMPLSFVLIKIFAPIKWSHQLLQPERRELYPELLGSNKLMHDIDNFLANIRGDQFVMKSPPLPGYWQRWITR